MAKLQTIMEQLQISDTVTEIKKPQQVEVPAQAALIAKEEPSPDVVSLSMIQAGIMADAPAVLPDLSTGSDESLQQTFDHCEAVMARE